MTVSVCGWNKTFLLLIKRHHHTSYCPQMTTQFRNKLKRWLFLCLSRPKLENNITSKIGLYRKKMQRQNHYPSISVGKGKNTTVFVGLYNEISIWSRAAICLGTRNKMRVIEIPRRSNSDRARGGGDCLVTICWLRPAVGHSVSCGQCVMVIVKSISVGPTFRTFATTGWH